MGEEFSSIVSKESHGISGLGFGNGWGLGGRMCSYSNEGPVVLKSENKKGRVSMALPFTNLYKTD